MAAVRYPPISDYALIGDCHSAALISRDGSVDWCCFHRFDARPCFARILDWSKGGYFRIAPTAPYSVARRYLPATNILETRFHTTDRVLILEDCLLIRPSSDPAEAEEVHPYHQLLRRVRCEDGRVEVRFEFAPRFDYGLTVPRLEKRAGDVVVTYGGAEAHHRRTGNAPADHVRRGRRAVTARI